MKKVLIFKVIIIILITFSFTGCIKKEDSAEIIETITTETADSSDPAPDTEESPGTDQETPDMTETPEDDIMERITPIIIFSSSDGNIQLYTMTSSGENATRLLEDSFIDNNGNFSTDGLNIIFDSNRAEALTCI